MSAFATELRACLAEILRGPVPEPDPADDPVRFFTQWLAGRNLGLVPIADAGTFAWPGQWIAAVRDGGADHALVMFGSPSGVWLDPGAADRRGAPIEAGWIVTPLDLHLPIDRPYGATQSVGTVAAILTAASAEAPLSRLDEAHAIAGSGLAGDRYAVGRGTFGPGRGYELTLVEGEVLDELELPWEDARRNVVTRGISLNGLVGHRFRIGSVECVGRRLAEPCAHLERLARPGLLRPLVHRGGLRADVETGGLIRLGDEIAAAD